MFKKSLNKLGLEQVLVNLFAIDFFCDSFSKIWNAFLIIKQPAYVYNVDVDLNCLAGFLIKTAERTLI